jgi:hypothetical protein
MPRKSQLTTIERYLIGVVAQLLCVGGVAWVAFQLQQDQIAPAILLPLAVGTVLGFSTSAISRAIGLRSRSITLVAAAIAGLLVVVAQDYIGHRHRLSSYDDQLRRQPLAAQTLNDDLAVKTRFTQYLVGKLRDEPLWWTLDALLTSGAALAVVAWQKRSHATAVGSLTLGGSEGSPGQAPATGKMHVPPEELV